MDKINFAFFGTTQYSKALLLALIENGFTPQVIFTMPEFFSISYSEKKVQNYNYADLKIIAQQHNIDYFEIDSTDERKVQRYHTTLQAYRLDLILVLGWYYMIPKTIRELASYGAWGIHASLLPKYAGGAPLNWAIINGEERSGVSLFRMEDGVDTGDIIAQGEFEIAFEDSIKEVYEKATETSKRLLIKTLSNLSHITFTPQDLSEQTRYSQRKPEDGALKLTMNAVDMYNFIRAQSSPYPGAYIRTVDGKKLVIEKARIEEFEI